MCTKRNTKSKVAYKEINMQGTCFYSLIHSFAVSLARMPSPNSTIRKSTKSNLGISYTPAFILYTLSIFAQWERQRGSRSLLLYNIILICYGMDYEWLSTCLALCHFRFVALASISVAAADGAVRLLKRFAFHI